MAKMMYVVGDGGSRRGKEMNAILWKPTSCVWGTTVSVLGAGMKISTTDDAVQSTQNRECAAADTGKDTWLMAVRAFGVAKLAAGFRDGVELKSEYTMRAVHELEDR